MCTLMDGMECVAACCRKSWDFWSFFKNDEDACPVVKYECVTVCVSGCYGVCCSVLQKMV